MDYYKYRKNNNDINCVYIVTIYGFSDCPSELLWVPQSKLFNDFNKAYQYFLLNSPKLNIQSESKISIFNPKDDKYDKYFIIENRIETTSKKPYGAVLARCLL